MAGCRVLYAVDISMKGGLDGAVLESEIGIFAHRAILHHQILTITERLFPRNMAANQSQVLGIPSQILPIDFRIIDRNILRLPEGILGIEHGMMDFHVLTVLERIVPILMIMVDVYVIRVHEQVVGVFYTTILNTHLVAVPQGFQGIGEYTVLEVDSRHTAEHLRSLHTAVPHHPVSTVPHRRAGTLGKEAIRSPEVPAFPEDIFPLEAASLGLYVMGFLDRGLSQMDGHSLKAQVMFAIQWPFATELLISD